ncbi:MAG: DUF4760 domain-containing protein [Gemmatimonadetes bacterium]|nr:DUF4760 domain-containing protein [Gemmatimonadota bacterium]
MNLATALNLISTAALVAGLAFAVAQIQQFRARRRRDAALALVQSYQSPEFVRAAFCCLALPDGEPEAAATPKEQREGMWLLMSTFESLGVLVYRGEVDIELVEDFFSGLIVTAWRSFEPVVKQSRQEVGRETYFEWFQWLAERVMAREAERPPVPAHIEHRHWRPPARQQPRALKLP